MRPIIKLIFGFSVIIAALAVIISFCTYRLHAAVWFACTAIFGYGSIKEHEVGTQKQPENYWTAVSLSGIADFFIGAYLYFIKPELSGWTCLFVPVAYICFTFSTQAVFHWLLITFFKKGNYLNPWDEIMKGFDQR